VANGQIQDSIKVVKLHDILQPMVPNGQIKDTIKLRHILILPVVAKSIETGWSFGLASSSTFRLSKRDTLSRTSNVQVVALYSLKKQFIAALNGSQYFKNENYVLNEQISFSSFPDKFWGVGKNAPDSAIEPYTFEQYYVYPHLLRSLGNKFFIGALFEFQNVMKIDYQKGGLFDKQNITGRTKYKVAGLGLSLTYDNRNNAFAPNKGGFAQIYFDHFDNALGSKYEFTYFVLDLRKYIKIYKQQVLALQFYALNNVGDSIPLRNLASLGGANSMRGFYSGRYRDKNLIVLQGEYRLPIYKRFGAVAFCGFGDVGSTIHDFSFPDLKYSFGGGLRYAINKSEKLNLRLDFGVGNHNAQGLYFQLGEAF
jgi:outer membrane protein assembly factor BamA